MSDEDNSCNKKIVERIKKLEEEKEELKKELKHIKSNPNTQETHKEKESENNQQISRREFLKKAGIGTIGLGALALTPSSALNIKDKDLDVFTGTSSSNVKKYFSVNQGGPVEIQNTDLIINQSFTDPSGTQHTGEVADASDISNIQSSSDVDHNSTNGGTNGNPHSNSASKTELNNHENSTKNVHGIGNNEIASKKDIQNQNLIYNEGFAPNLLG